MSAPILSYTPQAPEGVQPRRHAVQSPVGGGEPIALANLAWWKHTRQSSTTASADEPKRGFMDATRAETSPWWDIDLGSSVYVDSIRLWIASSIVGARLRIERYTFPTKAGDAPPGAVLIERALDEGGEIFVEARVVARFVRVTLIAPEGASVSLALQGAEILGADLFGDTLLDTYRRTFTLFADQPFLQERSSDGARFEVRHRFRDVWAMAERFAATLAEHIERDEGRVFLGICLRNRVEWIAADLAAVLRGWVVVPLSPDDSDERLASIFAHCPLDGLVVERGEAARFGRVAPASTYVVEYETLRSQAPSAAPKAPHPRKPDDLYTLLFTSGSTGTPKGAMRSYERFLAMVRSYGVTQPGFHLSFQPLSHLSERMFLPATIIHGAQIAFSPGGAQLLADLRAFEPSLVSSVPRLFEVVLAAHRRRLEAALAEVPIGEVERREAIEREMFAETRRVFGTRVQTVAVGSAPCSAEVLAFLRKCFADLWVMDGYGSTECGTITADGRIMPNVDVKLVAVESLDSESAREPSRGEIWVRTPHQIDGYFGDPVATAASLDGDGYFRTGDLGERTADGGVRVVGRVANVLKLGHGEFVAIDRIEATLGSCPGVDQIFLHPDGASSSLLAVVVPQRGAFDDDEAIAEDLVRRLRTHGRAMGLATFELPKAVWVEREAMTVASGLLTASGKLARPKVIAHYRDRLEELTRAAPTQTHEDSLEAKLVSLASRIAKRRVDLDEPLRDGLGIDSLAVAELLESAGEMLGHPIALTHWFEARSLRELALRLDQGQLHRPEKEDLARHDLELELPVDDRLDAPREPARAFLLTGATGFLGVHLLEALLAKPETEVVCLVRAGSDAEATTRMQRTIERFRIGIADRSRWRAVASDLASPQLGLEEASFAALAEHIDAIVHCGATVNWLQPYDAMRAANVLGTRALLALAATTPRKPFHFVSTISTAPADGDESTQLSFERARAAGGYALTKWVAESLVRRAGRLGMPIAIHRPAMITGHSRRGLGNADDFVNRYLRACVRAEMHLDLDGERLDMTPVDFVAEGIVALIHARPAAGETHHYTNIAHSMSHAALGKAIENSGARCEPASYARFRTTVLADHASPLRPLAAFFPEQGFAMHMGPWPSDKTRAELAALGIECPPVDDRLVATYLRELRTD